MGVLAGLPFLAGCEGIQSALDPAGRDAERIANLTWWLFGGGLLVWLLVVGLAIYVIRVKPGSHSPLLGRRLILWGGAILPTAILAGYLVYGLSMIPPLLAPAPPGSLRISVSGEQWWWRVRYLTPEGEHIELANEIRLPVGERVDLLLESPDVIHSFWVPSLAGKIDMLPGRVNRLSLEPTQTGTFRGACAEYCGGAHALMSFYVVVQERAAFDAWLARQAAPAQATSTPRGQTAFLSNGCGACHTIRGAPADGLIGPDLTHVGSRISLGAGIMPNEPEAFLQWISRTEELKPEVHMPAFGMLPEDDLRALATYLDGLE